MTRTMALSLAAIAILAAVLALFLSAHRSPGPQTFSGYVEADYVMVGSAVGGPLAVLDVARGDHVHSGARLFALDDAAERGARDEAEGRLQQAEAQLADLLTGRRPEEIDAIVAQRAQATAALQQSTTEFQRQTRLQAAGASSVQALDQARRQHDQDKARVDELDAQLRVARLPGRDEQINAAEAAVIAARGTLAQAKWRFAQMIGIAPADAIVVDTLFRPGEMVTAGNPVVQLLPPGNIKARFFVSEAEVARIAIGDTVAVSCDGCGAPLSATVSFISPQAEFTPPVIYSREQRSRLVFLVEAKPTERPERLRVGQPIDVTKAQP
jgi:HlyD family secretion protein